MKTLKDVLYFVFNAIDLPTELEETQQKNIQARKCLDNYLQSGIVSDDSIKEAQIKIDKVLYIEKNKKDIRDYSWDIDNERNKLVDIVADLNGVVLVCDVKIPMCHGMLLKIVIIFKLIAMTVKIHFILHVANGIYIIIHNFDKYTYTYSNTNTSIFIFILVPILNFFQDVTNK